MLVFDNASANFSDVRGAVRDFENAQLMESAHNIGIAAALNRISRFAIERGCVWLITLDQDSICAPGMVATLREHIDDSTPLVTPYIVDRTKSRWKRTHGWNFLQSSTIGERRARARSRPERC